MSSRLKTTNLPKKTGVIKLPDVPLSYDNYTPVFCLNQLQNDYSLRRCDKDEKAAFADQLALLSKMKWKEIISSQRHGNGYEKISRNSLNPPIPLEITDEVRFIAFRFCGKKSFVGYRSENILKIVWIDNKFDVYDHS